MGDGGEELPNVIEMRFAINMIRCVYISHGIVDLIKLDIFSRSSQVLGEKKVS